MKNLKILVVDDEPDLLEVLALQFEMSGAFVTKASNGLTALDLVMKSPVDLILSDVRMPHGDGLSLLRNVRKLNPTWPIFFLMTGFSDFSTAEAKELGANEVLSKPLEQKFLDACLLRYFPDKVSDANG